MKKMAQLTHDVVIVGGGPAGMSAALVLGRSRRKVLLIDAGKPRNAVTLHSHGFLTRDGITPKEFRDISIHQLMKYESVSIKGDIVIRIEPEESIFTIHTQSGSRYIGKKVIIATGMKDHLPSIPGLQEVYGKSVFPCPYCDGWEHRDEPLAVFGQGEKLVDFTKLIANWSKDLLVFTNGPTNWSVSDLEKLNTYNIDVIDGHIKEVSSTNGFLKSIILEDGEVFKRSAGFIMNVDATQSSTIPEMLGVPYNHHGGYETDPHGLTCVPGLYVIGDATHAFSGLVGAAGEGYEVGVSINHKLVEEEWNMPG
ncbi:FAD-dependent oxidoreductase [Pontibacillus yanchengensis]|uniref:FAD-dependent oxidoreductase n=1 Tax=Pontibacillus yanchengensis TaxID=462910 RepID=A0ACC7VKT4_9BACI|nr:FAD-dependent oxidoreductase [Pontibacillus yanchengensis]